MKLRRLLLSGILSSTAVWGWAQPAAVVSTNPPSWDVSASLGATLTRGNSETLMLSANIAANKKWDKNELNLGADAVYGENTVEVNGVETTEKNAEAYHGFAQYNRLFSERLFGYVRVDALHVTEQTPALDSERGQAAQRRVDDGDRADTPRVAVGLE